MALNFREDPSDLKMPKNDPSLAFGSPRLRRDQIRVVIRMIEGAQVEGLVHIMPATRPLDLLNQQGEDFIAVTEAHLTEPGGSPQDLDFVAVSKLQIARMYESKKPESGL